MLHYLHISITLNKILFFMQKKHIIVILILTVYSLQSIVAQTFADKKFYLLDSLNLETLLERDKILIDTLLQEFHKAKEDSVVSRKYLINVLSI